MAEESFQERTEKATPRKRREARDKGEVARSMEVNSAVVLLVGVVAIKVFGGTMTREMAGSMRWYFSNLSSLELNADSLYGFFLSALKSTALALAPVAGAIMVAGTAACLVQGGWVFSGEPLKPKFNKINPVSGFQRIFSSRGFVELLKGCFKLAIVGIVGYQVLKKEWNSYPLLIDRDVAEIMLFTGRISFTLIMRMGFVLLFLAIADYAYKRYEFEKKLRMTKQEIKEEFKRSEGDPLIKSRIRSIQFKLARQRMLKDVPKATVVVTNPIHLAVALKYESGKMPAPVVVAKGARLLAEKIKTIAREHGIPVIENRPLAQVLYKTTSVGSEIPYNLYKAVAEVLAYVYRLKKKRTAAARSAVR